MRTFLLWLCLSLPLLAVDYVDGTVLLLDVPSAGHPGYVTITDSGSGGPDTIVRTFPIFTPGDRIKVWYTAGTKINNRVTQQTCNDPCTISMHRDWGWQYEWYEEVNAAGASLSPVRDSGATPVILPLVEEPIHTVGNWNFPIEVVGQDNYTEHVQVNVPNGSVLTGLRFYIRCHSCGFRGQLPVDTKASIQINGGPWTTISNANVTGVGELSYYGGVGGFIHLQEFTLTIPDGTVVTGTNTIGLRFNGSDGVTSGWRARDLNFWEPNMVIDQLVSSGGTVTATLHSAQPQLATNNWLNIQGAPGIRGRFNGPRQITVVDSTHFTFQACGTNPDLINCTAPDGTYVVPTANDVGTVQPQILAARQLIPQSAYTQEDPTTWVAPPGGNATNGQNWFNNSALFVPNTPYLNNVLQSSHCQTCHADIPNTANQTGFDLKYFNYSNKVIIQRTVFHHLTGQQGLDIAAYIRNQPTTPPPMARPWNSAYQPCPTLDSNPAANWAAGGGCDCVETYATDWLEYAAPGGVYTSWGLTSWLNMRQLPEPYPFPDWNDHLAPIFPGDYPFTTPFNSSSVPTYYNNALAAITVGNVASYTGYDHSMSTFRGQVVTYDQTNDTARPNFSAPAYLRPSLYAIALQSIFQWGIVKSWEIVHGGGFEGNLDSVYTNQYGASTNGYQTRGWFSGIHFYLADHIAGLNPNGTGNYDSTPQSYNVQSNIAYVYQTTVDCGNRRLTGNSPWDIGYTWIFLFTGGGTWRSNDYLADLAMIIGPQCSADDPNLFPSGGSAFNTQTIISASVTEQITGNLTRRFSTDAQQVAKATQLAKTLTAVLGHYTPTQWAAENAVHPCTNATNGALQSLSTCDSISWYLPLWKDWGVDATTLNNLVTAANTAFPSHNFATDLAATVTGTWTCGNSTLNPLIGNECKPSYHRFSNQP